VSRQIKPIAGASVQDEIAVSAARRFSSSCSRSLPANQHREGPEATAPFSPMGIARVPSSGHKNTPVKY
jgi:hypothetical protein